MPNWTTNRLEFDSVEDAQRVWEGMQIEVPKWESDEFNNSVKTSETIKRFSYETIIPTPKTKEECPPNFLIDENSHVSIEEDRPWFNWYNWNCANWGVKWDACDPAIVDNIIYFSSPWEPPYNHLFQKIAEKFNVKFSLAVDNEDGGWQEEDYIFSPDEDMVTETSEWQIEENREREEEWDEEYNTEDDEE